MITPDVAEAAKRAREAGTLLAVVEFLCRTRFTVTPRLLVAEAKKLGVPTPTFYEDVRSVFVEAIAAGFCEKSSRMIYTSKITGDKP